MFFSFQAKNTMIFQKFKNLLFLGIFLLAYSHKNILIFNSSYYRAGRSAFTSEGDMIIEYSYQNKRLFYGLKQNGKHYFKEDNKNVPTKFLEIGTDGNERYQSRNIFISLNNTNDNKEYLFSIGYYNLSTTTITELHDLEKNKYLIKDTKELLGNNLVSFSLYRLNNTQNYLLVYLTESNCFLNLFSFRNFSLNNVIVKSLSFGDITGSNKVINSFPMNDKIILFYPYTSYYKINRYNLDFTNNGYQIQIDTITYVNGLFFKGLHLIDDIMAFIYFTANSKTSLKINIGYIEYSSTFKSKLNFYFSSQSFEYDNSLNDFIKITNNRLAYIGKSDTSIFCIILLDIYNNAQNMKIRIFNFDLIDHNINKEFEAIKFNNFLAISSTVTNDNINDYSIFFLFGYVNGTDDYIDIGKYITDNTNGNNNLVLDLTENTIIDNNIFGYEILKEQIKLVYIPESLSFYNENNNIRLDNDGILEKNYILQSNGIFSGNNSYLEYQIIITEPDYDIFNNKSSEIFNCSSIGITFVDEINYYNKSIFYGRTNTLFFSNHSCHDYCLTCEELGSSDNDQKCISCKEEYSYFYPGDFTSNCVPENYFYDNENQQLIECTDLNSYFYLDENNKKICFKNIRGCPGEYPNLNLEKKECAKNNSSEYSEKVISENIYSDNIYSEEIYFENIYSEFSSITNYTSTDYSNGNYTLFFKENEDAYNYMLDILYNFEPEKDNSIYLKTESNMSFELTTISEEKNQLNGISTRDNLSIIDFGICENILRDHFNISENISLIFLKSENLNTIPSKKNVQYEIYESINKTKLNISICEGVDINIYFPIELNNQTQKLYEDLKQQGYDLFNINDKFYQDICTPYKSDNGTDILLSDRINDIYNKNNNLTSCQGNCEYSNYISENKLLKCNCKVNTESIDYKNQEKFVPKKLYESFYEVLKYSNYKILKCYKLIFKKEIVLSNIGSILVLIFFGIYFLFLMVFVFKGIDRLKIDIIKINFDNQKEQFQNKNSNKIYLYIKIQLIIITTIEFSKKNKI